MLGQGENAQAIQPCKFGRGDGLLNYYLFNYQLKGGNLSPGSIGTVLV